MIGRLLIIGDPHVTTSDLEDCQALLDLCLKTAKEHEAGKIIILGDLYNNHSVLDTRCVDFWQNNLKALSRIAPVYAIVGNHDQCTPTIREPHALLSHKDIQNVFVVDELFLDPDFTAVPYCADPLEFIQVVKNSFSPDRPKILFCHQTFMGADQGKGFFSKEAVEATCIPYKMVISGHIHTPMRFSKVWYPGAPRWKTLTDANTDRFIYILDQKVTAIPTDSVCKRIYKFEDSVDSPCEVITKGPNADIRIDIHGDPVYIKERMMELKAKHNARCRGFPTKAKSNKVSESEGLTQAFQKFSNNFVPPYKTDLTKLLNEVNFRL